MRSIKILANSYVLLLLIIPSLTGCGLRQRGDALKPNNKENIDIALPEIDDADEWRMIAEANFDNAEMGNITVVETDSGLAWSVKDGVGCIAGVSSDARWKGNHVALEIPEGPHSRLELSGAFKIIKGDGYLLVGLWGIVNEKQDADGPLCLYYDGTANQRKYAIPIRWMNLPCSVVGGSDQLPGIGDETESFHQLRIVLDRRDDTITYFVDERQIGVVRYEGELPPIVRVQMDLETPNKGTELEVHFKNLRVKSSGARYLDQS